MKTKNTLFTLFLFILFTGLKSQTLPVTGHFLNTENEKIQASYTLSCEGKVIDSGKDLENLVLDLTVNKMYLLKVSSEDYKTKTICFSIKPEMNENNYMFEFDVCLSKIQNTKNTSNISDDSSKKESSGNAVLKSSNSYSDSFVSLKSL